MAKENQAKFITSTSAVTGIMAHVYWVLSNFKSPNFNDLSSGYDTEA